MSRPRRRGPALCETPNFDLKDRPLHAHHRSHCQHPAPIAFIGNRTFNQHHNLLYLPQRETPPLDVPPPVPFNYNDENVQTWDMTNSTVVYSTPAVGSCASQRRAAQWRQWQEEIIPSMIGPYTRLMADTESLCRDPPEPHLTCLDARELKIKIIQFS